MSTDLTPAQAKVFSFLQQWIATAGYPPTRAEITRHFAWRSCNAAEEHLRALARKGAIFLIPGVSRGIRIVKVTA